MGIPTADEQIRFLRDVQALLEDGQFAATYKFALLIALADLAVESGVSDDRPLEVPLRAIAEKFIEYYWQQAHPFWAGESASVLHQNRGGQASVIKVVLRLRADGYTSTAALRRDAVAWSATIGQVARIVRNMPLYRLQTVGGVLRTFLYPHRVERGAIVLSRGVAFCLRQFHTLVTGQARDRWVRKVRQINENLYLLGHTQDMERFMFGSGREPIHQHLEVLTELQRGLCLYCRKSLSAATAHVDHFVPWSLQRCDELPNLVAAHASCNLEKRDWLAAEPHLERWVIRNDEGRQSLRSTSPFATIDPTTRVTRVARWAYDRAYEMELPAWVRARELMPLSRGYARLL